MDELELEAHGGKVKLINHNRSWCELYLLANGQDIFLGGNSLDTIISKLLISFIPEKDRKHFTYQDMELFHVFNLMGPLAVVAGKERDNFGIELIFISTEGNVIPMVTLSIEDIKEWISKLIEFMAIYMYNTLPPA